MVWDTVVYIHKHVQYKLLFNIHMYACELYKIMIMELICTPLRIVYACNVRLWEVCDGELELDCGREVCDGECGREVCDGEIVHMEGRFVMVRLCT